MRKQIISLMLMFLFAFQLMPTGTIATPNDAISFPDPNFEAVVRAVIDKLDGPVTRADLSGVKELEISDRDINSLSGIEYFTALEYLRCDGSQITELDLSSNLALIYLYLVNNSKLSSINVRNNTMLEFLLLSGTSVTELDVRNNSSLLSISIISTPLTELDLSKNPSLKWLSIHGEIKLTELDLRNQNSLTYILITNKTHIKYSLDDNAYADLETLYLQNNDLTYIDLSKFPSLTYLDLYNNQLEEIDLSCNSALKSLIIYNNRIEVLDVSKNTALTYLICAKNPLTSLDVSKNAALEYLGCSENQLTSLDVSKNTALVYLYCSENQLTSLDVSKNTALEILSIPYNQLTELDISKNHAMRWLLCPNNRLTSITLSPTAPYEIISVDENFLVNKNAVVGRKINWEQENFKYEPQQKQEFAHNLETADAWAHPEITSAIEKGFVPADVQNKYRNVITREEFCRMAVKFVEYATGKTIDEVMAEKGVSRNPGAFTDTSDQDILAAFALGITTGTGNNKFTPNGRFNREQAATMLMRLSKVVGIGEESSSSAGFADSSKASNWAKDAIDFVRSNNIMQGTGNNNFSPKSAFTRQQSIVTFDRIG